MGIKTSDCPLAIGSNELETVSPSIRIATEHAEVAVSNANIFKILDFLFATKPCHLRQKQEKSTIIGNVNIKCTVNYE